MAVAGLQNVSAFGPSFCGESRSSTRASSLLQMWRELEGDHVVSHSNGSRPQRNDSGSECLSSTMSVGDNGDDVSEDADEIENRGTRNLELEHEDNNSVVSEQSSDLGEIERERVRQIFREWMDSGARGHSSGGFNRSGPQWLGENECERVRIIREWVQMNTQQKNSRGSIREGDTEVGSQFEQVRDGLAISQNQIGGRKKIRRLCGRQTLLDLLLRAQSERQKELQGLYERRPVTDFAHRNRIQALLRGRFLKNERLTRDERPSSVAASELGLLRQRHTVSGLREGFLSKIDYTASTSMNSTDSRSSSSDEINDASVFTHEESVVREIHTAESESAAHENRSQPELILHSNEEQVPVSGIARREPEEVSLDNGHVCSSQEKISVPQTSTSDALRNVECANDASIEHTFNTHIEHTDNTHIEHTDNTHIEHADATIVNESLSQSEDGNENSVPEVSNEHHELQTNTSYVHGGNTNEEHDLHDASAQTDELEESVISAEDSAWQQLTTVEYNEWADGRTEDMERSIEENSASQWFPETSDNNAVEQDEMQESHEDWPGHDFQDAIDGWLDMPSRQTSIGRIDTVYFPDVDNIQSLELRELFSRRRVSSLLRSSFRESLNQVLQSHVERLGHASGDWEMDDASAFHELVDQGQEHLHSDEPLALSDNADRSLFAPTESHPLWDEDFHAANWSNNESNQQFGTEWEVINELRIDMARLQQRMNNMQSMLEACMDMQIELQRSVRQEVSAALNRSIFSKDESQGIKLHDESQWDHVRKGICCLCAESKIDSLLYRCGHMCACLKCAENLVTGMGKCPMCQAPVVEVVRAYFIQS